MYIPSDSVKLSTPCSLILFGPSGAGKTTLLKNILLGDNVFQQPINRLIFVYGGADQSLYADIRRAIPNSTFIENWSEKLLENKALYTDVPEGTNTALIIDDCIAQAGNSPFLVDCFVKYRSRWNLNIILLSQVIFQQDLKGLRTISRNATGMFLLRNRRGRQSLKILASQMGVDNVKAFMKIFESATNEFGYLFCDMSGWLDFECLRLRSGLLPDEQTTCYEFIE